MQSISFLSYLTFDTWFLSGLDLARKPAFISLVQGLQARAFVPSLFFNVPLGSRIELGSSYLHNISDTFFITVIKHSAQSNS